MAPEGRIILVPLLLLAVLAGLGLLLAPRPWLQGIVGFIWVLAGLSLVFFRDPVRLPPKDPNAFVSPADGKVVAIQPVEYDEHIGGEALQVAIFLSLFNVHVQRVPTDGHVDSTQHRSGRFLAAFNPGASEKNEQVVTCFTGKGGKFKVKQIAGILARRIICHMRPHSSVQRGNRLGFIRFGSRVEIIVPADFQLQVTVGKRVEGITTIIGYFSS
ncbi:MAG: phosphatidylserine decarboxylase family protein [Fidelibacterota bacterium]|nr:MAG: phosphatidylserine decarboxylase family protein [Candidatus Neomarinimicrobiota bacterium]